MNRIYKSSVAALLAGFTYFILMPQPAQALFGATCVPRLQNCMCTYQKPCPVNDSRFNGNLTGTNNLLNIQDELQAELQKKMQMLNSGIACESIGNVPGLNAIGIDINALLKAQIPNLNLGQLQIPGLESLQRELEKLNLSTTMLQDIISGNLSPSEFLDMARAAGVDISQLEQLGLNLSTLQNLSMGSLDSIMSAGMDSLQKELGDLGMGADILNQLASGQITTENFLSVAQQAGLGIPNLEELGLSLDVLNSLSAGDLSSLGIPNVDVIVNNVAKIQISPAIIQNMIGGQLNPQQLLTMAEASGLGPMTLQHMGVSPETLASIAQGQISPQQMLEFSEALNFKSTALESLGITPDLIGNIANGSLNPNAIMNIANGAGLSLPDLQGLGLDPSSLTSMIQQGPSGLMSTLQGAGMGNPMLSSLNIDAGMLGKIASGELPASAINDLMANTGLDPSAIVIPSINGPIAALEGMQDAVNAPLSAINDQLSQMGSQLNQMINIPIPQIPGLGGILSNCGSGVSPDLSVGGGIAGAGGAPVPGGGTPAPTGGGGEETGGGGAGSTGTLAGTGTNSGAVCTPNRPLISNMTPPNDISTDGNVATLDFAMAGQGDIFAQEEALGDAKGEASRTYATALARAIIMRPLIVEALDSITAIEQQLDLISANGTIEEAMRMNSSIKVHLLGANAESTSLKSFLASMMAVETFDTLTFTPIPLFPHDSQWEQDMEETVRRTAGTLADTSEQELATSKAYGQLNFQAREAIKAHARAKDYVTMTETTPGVVATINFHETQKESLYHMEQQIRGALEQLYEDPDAAWAILHNDLKANAGDYMDRNKWSSGQARADSMSDMITAQSATTRYGRRIQVSAGSNDEPATYTTIPEMPYSYPFVNERLAPGDPMEIRRPISLMGGGSNGDNDEPPPPAMSGGIQTYFETFRREASWAPLRRGSGNRTMTGAFWSEMLAYAPDCLSGPMENNAANLLNRPDMFDLNPSCTHLTWMDGDAEDYISQSNLGGADASLWYSKILMDKILLQANVTTPTDLVQSVVNQAQNALNFEQTNNIETAFRGFGYAPAANHVVAIRDMLTGIVNDTSLSTTPVMPVIQP